MRCNVNLTCNVSIIIPTFNEEEGISGVLSSIPADVADEIIVVDGSTDRTAEIARTFGVTVIHEPRRGYGRALQTGIENAHGELVVYMDGDCTYDPSEIRGMIALVQRGECDAVLGNRLKHHNNSGMAFQNRLGNRILSHIFSTLFHVGLGDTQCGLRVLPRKSLLNWRYRSYGMAYVTEQLAKLVKAGYRVGEVPVSYRRRLGRSKLRRIRDGFEILLTMLRERLQG